MDDETVKKQVAHEVGAALDALSIAELEARIELLHAEIARISTTIAHKKDSKSAAENFFKS